MAYFVKFFLYKVYLVAERRYNPPMDTPAINALGARQRSLLTALLEKKDGLTADELAAQLDITRSAVHQHLSALEQSGYIERDIRAPQGGRPGFAWRLTERGVHLFPKQYAMFSDLLIRSIKEKLGSEGLAQSMRSLGKTLAGQHLHQLANKKPADKISEVTTIMQQLGYQARKAKDPGKDLPLIDARNCIYHHLAKDHAEVCELDLALLETLLDADIEHVECMVRGGKACQFRVGKRRSKKRK